MKNYLFIVIIGFLCILQSVKSIEKELTIYIEAGTESCFYQQIKSGEVIDIDYQVIDGGHGDLDINFRLVDSTGRILLTDFKRSENNHRHDATMDGDYRFCFDNSFSSYNTKTVFFELIIEGEDNGQWQFDENINFENNSQDLIAKDVHNIINNVRSHLTKARNIQDLLKSTEARDRNLAEENFFKVNTFSFIQLLLMIVVGFIQVVMVRSLFDNHSRVHKIWKKLDIASRSF
ncbi:unnamed protein product [Psylliodes chrysocephalus]|uniref:GOLD domain-containing protein n=1 Tax=Psylliodes chrysocephalus TaxID=3402493 RepID=A0A9P0G8M9_9CUCU|nr:unnamed protein product [Psylliodes chrysocephala]